MGVGLTKIKDLRASGALPYVRIGSAVRINRVDLDAYIERNTVRPITKTKTRRG